MHNVTKQDIVNEVSKATGLTYSDTKIAVEEFMKTVGDILQQGHNIEIRGFGTFLTKIRKPRPARNLKTGEVVPLKKRVVPLFKFSSSLKDEVNKLAENSPSDNTAGINGYTGG
ncbi:MAG: HU family DNA-binding protein [Fibrobacterota bacterium]